MKRKPVLVTLFMLIAALFTLVTGRAAAQLQGAYILQRSVISSAPSPAQVGGNYTLSAVVGQPVLGTSSGAGYILLSGYTEPISKDAVLYIPLIAR